MKFNRFFQLTALSAATCCAFAQGSLTPPPGPPAPTMKSLDQIEPRVLVKALPFVITNSGSYYLATNLTLQAEENGITIRADDVTLDLNNFSLAGARIGHGIFVDGARHNVKVRNGAITNWEVGIQAPGAAQFSAQNIVCRGNSSHGLVAGSHTRLVDVTSTGNTGAGFGAGPGSTLSKTRALGNGSAGFFLGEGSTLENCDALNNSGPGVQGDAGVTIKSSTVRANGGHGVLLTANAHVLSTSVSKNGGNGLQLGEGAKVSECQVTHNVQTGISAAADAQIANSRAASNTVGIDVGSGSVVEKCAAQKNNGPGIRAFAECSVRNNHCTGNFNARNGAGIYVTGSDSVIEGNYVAVNDQGIVVAEKGNFLRSNMAANNSINYMLVGEQVAAPTYSGSAEELDRAWSNAEF